MLQLALTIIIFLIIVIPVGRYMYHIATWNHTLADPVFDRLDGVIYKIGGVNPHQGMNWKQYALALVGTNAVMVAIGYLILRIQSVGIFNPNNIGNMEPTLAFNTIISFMTNTNLQHYSGESGLSYLSQMLVIIFMMFVSAASGYAACIAFIRGLTGKTKDDVGNFFADLTRITTRLLLPFSIVGGLLLVWQGVPQNFDSNVVLNTLEGTFQTIAMGPIAALEIIKHLGTNGGGFLGANSSTPLENPTIISDLIELYSMMLFPGACVITFGKMVRGRRKKDDKDDDDKNSPKGGASGGQLSTTSSAGTSHGPRLNDHSLTAAIYGWEGRTIFLAMGIIFLVGLSVCYWAELQGNPALAKIGLSQSMGSMEGKMCIRDSHRTVALDLSPVGVRRVHRAVVPLLASRAAIRGRGIGAGLAGLVLSAVIAAGGQRQAHGQGQNKRKSLFHSYVSSNSFSKPQGSLPVTLSHFSTLMRYCKEENEKFF